jgi:hypothetical protein
LRIPLARHQAAAALLAGPTNEERPAKRRRVDDSYKGVWKRAQPSREIALTFPRTVGRANTPSPPRPRARPLQVLVPVNTQGDHAAAVQLNAEINPGRGRGGRGARGRGRAGRGARGRGRGRA